MKARELVKPLALILLWLFISTTGAAAGENKGKWPGIDESVVEKVAKEQGREARDPLINTDQGDLLLFVFLLAGAVGGFIGGYTWRMLVAEKDLKPKKESPGLT